jgi:hypothetical protein
MGSRLTPRPLAVSVAYNVLTRNGAPLKLTGPVLAAIFPGRRRHPESGRQLRHPHHRGDHR